MKTNKSGSSPRTSENSINQGVQGGVPPWFQIETSIGVSDDCNGTTISKTKDDLNRNTHVTQNPTNFVPLTSSPNTLSKVQFSSRPRPEHPLNLISFPATGGNNDWKIEAVTPAFTKNSTLFGSISTAKELLSGYNFNHDTHYLRHTKSEISKSLGKTKSKLGQDAEQSERRIPERKVQTAKPSLLKLDNPKSTLFSSSKTSFLGNKLISSLPSIKPSNIPDDTMSRIQPGKVASAVFIPSNFNEKIGGKSKRNKTANNRLHKGRTAKPSLSSNALPFFSQVVNSNLNSGEKEESWENGLKPNLTSKDGQSNRKVLSGAMRISVPSLSTKSNHESVQALREGEERGQCPESIRMEGMGLKEFPHFGGNEGPNLKLLSLQKNLISRVENVSTHLSHLVVLDLYDNRIERIMGLQGLASLRVLLLGKNRVSRIEGLEGLKRLEILDLHGNIIRCVENLGTLSSLRVLNLAGNHLRSIRSLGPQGLPSLVELNLKRNRIKNLEGLVKAPHLKKLLLANNDLQRNQLLIMLPWMTTLDRGAITEEMRLEAKNWHKNKLAEDEERRKEQARLRTVSPTGGPPNSREQSIYQARRRWESVKNFVKNSNSKPVNASSPPPSCETYKGKEIPEDFEIEDDCSKPRLEESFHQKVVLTEYPGGVISLNLAQLKGLDLDLNQQEENHTPQQDSCLPSLNDQSPPPLQPETKNYVITHSPSRLSPKQDLEMISKKVDRIENHGIEIAGDVSVEQDVSFSNEKLDSAVIQEESYATQGIAIAIVRPLPRDSSKTENNETVYDCGESSNEILNLSPTLYDYHSSNTDVEKYISINSNSNEIIVPQSSELLSLQDQNFETVCTTNGNLCCDLLLNKNDTTELENPNLVSESEYHEKFNLESNSELTCFISGSQETSLSSFNFQRESTKIEFLNEECSAQGNAHNETTIDDHILPFRNYSKRRIFRSASFDGRMLELATDESNKPDQSDEISGSFNENLTALTACDTNPNMKTGGYVRKQLVPRKSSLQRTKMRDRPVRVQSSSSLSTSLKMTTTMTSLTQTVNSFGIKDIRGGHTRQLRRCDSAAIGVGISNITALENDAGRNPLPSSTMKRQGSDFLVEIDEKMLSIYGQGALKHTLTGFPANVTIIVTTAKFNYISFDIIIPYFSKLRQVYPNLEHFQFRANNITKLSQLNAFSELQGITSLHISKEGNPLVTKSHNWMNYAGYRLSHWGLQNVNGKEVLSEFRNGQVGPAKSFESLGFLALSCLPQTALTPLAKRLHLLHCFCCCSPSSSSDDSGKGKQVGSKGGDNGRCSSPNQDFSSNICTSWEDPVLLDVIGKEALVYCPQNDAKSTKAQQPSLLDVEFPPFNASTLEKILHSGISVLQKLQRLENSWPSLMKEIVKEILTDFTEIDEFVNKELQNCHDSAIPRRTQQLDASNEKQTIITRLKISPKREIKVYSKRRRTKFERNCRAKWNMV